MRGCGEEEEEMMREEGGGEKSFENASQQKGKYRKWKQELKKVDAILEHTACDRPKLVTGDQAYMVKSH